MGQMQKNTKNIENTGNIYKNLGKYGKLNNTRKIQQTYRGKNRKRKKKKKHIYIYIYMAVSRLFCAPITPKPKEAHKL